MIRKLRAKLIAISMLSLLAVLVVVMGAVNGINYHEIIAEADGILSILREHGGTFPQRTGDNKPGGKPRDRFIPPELPYESRYFSVFLAPDGTVMEVDTGKIAAVDQETAVQLASRIWEEGNSKGFVGDYRYVRSQEEEGDRIIFLDCRKSLSTFRTFLWASCAISLLGFLAVLGMILGFSRRIVQPVLESYEKQKRFITDAGHEIKTPVTIIDADAEVLAMDLGENEWLRDIQVQTKRLAALTRDLVFLSRMEEDRPQLEKIAFPFSDLVSETAQSFQGLAKAQDKTVQLSIQPMITLVGEEKSLRQLVSILMDNALKYSKEEGWIRLSLERQRKTVFLTVENSTDAPLPQRLEDLFERFYRGDSSRNSQTGGYGLGLSIAKAIVETHGGRIGASRDGADHLRIQVQLPAGPSEREERQQEE